MTASPTNATALLLACLAGCRWIDLDPNLDLDPRPGPREQQLCRSVTDVDDDGRPDAVTTFFYDGDGRIQSYEARRNLDEMPYGGISGGPQGEHVVYGTQEYDENGNLVRESTETVDSFDGRTTWWARTWQYDELGRMSGSEWDDDGDGTPEYFQQWRYDEAGCETALLDRADDLADGDWHPVVEAVCDTDGRPVRTCDNGFDNPTSCSDYEYYPDRAVETWTRNVDSELRPSGRIIKWLDLYGRVARVERFTSPFGEDDLQDYWLHTYNAYGNEVEVRQVHVASEYIRDQVLTNEYAFVDEGGCPPDSSKGPQGRGSSSR